MGEAVQSGVRQNGIIKERLPFIHVAIAGDDRGGSSVPLDDDLVEIARFLRCELLEAQIVDDQEIRADEFHKLSLEGVVRATLP